ncbi:FMN-binding glutamate synthase family protein [Pigmentiphaga soli]|uniref:FMN-binding glutamate synthase family protein n=1 Tax=Pigmentiphaga soli TaxID=1007095 RepID=A0ABP8GC76_9BURK
MPWFAVRYTTFWFAVLATAVFAFLAPRGIGWLIAALVFGALTLLGIYDQFQRRHAIRRNYPILGNLRFMFELIRPEIRQYFLEDDTNATPFSRNQRSIVYQRAKQELDKRPFGTQEDVYERRYEWINHSLAPVHIENFDFRVAIGGPDCSQPYSASVLNISAMSFGALSGNAILALNTGARKGNFAHDTGEGGISRYHRQPGGDLIWNIGSGYFGCRDDNGDFSEQAFVANATRPQVRMIEIKLSQGAKPGHGGILPGPKVTPEIAEARGVLVGVDCNSPSAHSAFGTPIGLMEFVARLRRLSGGKPVGFKLCIGHPWEWFAIVKAMLHTGITPDFVVVDGAEGGTGAAPVEFVDHVGVPLQDGLLLVHNTLVGAGLRDRIRVGASGKIITAFDIARTMAMGADWCNSARGFMFALGCIQAQSCHNDRCPTGVATQDPLRQRALVVEDKAERVYNFHRNTLRAVSELVSAAGLDHPGKLGPEHIVRRVSGNEVRLLAGLFPFLEPGDLLEGRMRHEVYRRYWPMAQAESFAPAADVPHPPGADSLVA